MEWLVSPEALIALAALTLMEIVLGVDNIIFISVLVGRLPPEQRDRARFIGLGIALVSRILLLLMITWIMRLQANLFEVLGTGISGRDLILILGGLFLLAKATLEIHEAVEGPEQEARKVAATSAASVMIQIGLIDIVFSLDSVITAVGMVDDVRIMVVAVLLAVGIMLFSARAIGQFVDERPTIKMLALSFLVLIGTSLVADGIDLHIPKGYIYFAMAFSVLVEMLNLRIRGRGEPVALHKHPPR